MLEKKIEEINEYFRGLYKSKNDEYILNVEFPNTWKVWVKKIDGNVAISNQLIKNNEQTNEYLFSSRSVNHSGIIDFVNQIKSQNIEMEEKRLLYKEKIADLANIFDNNPISKLRNIAFKFEKRKAEKPVSDEALKKAE